MVEASPAEVSTDLPDSAAGGVVRLIVPADAAYLSVLRSVTAALAARRDFTIEEIDDLRIAVDEACALLLPHSADSSSLEAEFTGDRDRLHITVTVKPQDRETRLNRDGFAWLVLAALTDTAEILLADGSIGVVLLKIRGARA